MNSRFTLLAASLLLITGTLLSASSNAQDPQLPSLIYQANSSNNHINVLAFEDGGGTATQFNTTTANQNTEIRALGFRAGGADLVAADRIGKIEIYRNLSEPPVTVCDAKDATPDDCPSAPDGITNASAFMAVVDSSPGGSQPARIWSFEVCDFGTCPSGFYPGQIVDDDVCVGEEIGGVCMGTRASLLAETALVRAPFTFDDGNGGNDPDVGVIGDVLILVEDPAALLILPRCAMTGDCAVPQPKVVIPTAGFGGATPTGMTWVRGTPFVLFTNADGVIQRFTFNGGVAELAGDPFDQGLGNGTLKIKSGTNASGNPIAVLNRRNHGDSFLYDISLGAGGPEPIGGGPTAVITSGIESPNGLALANIASLADTSACSTGSGCDPSGILQHFFPQGVGNLGLLIEDVTHVLADPRHPACSSALAASEFDPALPSDVIIPSFLCAQNDLYFITATLATPVPDGVVETVAFEDLLAGTPLDCYSGIGDINPPTTPDLDEQLVQLWAPFGAEPDIVESPVGIESTIGCQNPSRGGGRGLSLFVVGLSYVDDTDMVAQARDKLQNLQATVLASECNKGKLCKQASGAIKAAIRTWSRRQDSKTLNSLADLRSIVDANSQLFNGATAENFAGNIIARIDNWVFTHASKIVPYE